MEPAEKDIVIKKIMEMPAKQIEKVMIFIAGLEAGRPKTEDSDHTGIANKRIHPKE